MKKPKFLKDWEDWVTCYVDASYSPQTKVGTYAVWVRHDEGRVQYTGTCPPYVKDSMLAETFGVRRALDHALQAYPRAKEVLICCDCKGALRLCTDILEPPKGDHLTKLYEEIQDFRRRLPIRTKYVPGHGRANSPTGAFLNGWCDRAAGRIRKNIEGSKYHA
ncbi:MAG: reverse transcriptase-like protein [Candidatus Altiarchaeales archaeon]|nr:reverse transcriptase-like protein [Candidatus Altiarchaeales archaeon]